MDAVTQTQSSTRTARIDPVTTEIVRNGLTIMGVTPVEEMH